MRAEIRKKLKSREGVTILFALLAFLVVTMVSMVIISAAVTAVKTTHREGQAIQRAASLESAAAFLCAELDGATYKKTVVSKEGSADQITVTDTDNAFRPEMYAVVKQIEAGAAAGTPAACTIEAPDASMSNVTVTYELSENTDVQGNTTTYSIWYELREDGGRKSYLSFKIRVEKEITGEGDQIVDESGAVTGYATTTTTVTSYTWTDPRFSSMKDAKGE